MTNKIYIIGSGFDQHHGVNTCYKAYKTYLENINPDMVNKIDKIFEDNGINSDDIIEWAELENYLSFMHKYDEEEIEEIYEYSFGNAEKDIDRASYWSDPMHNANYKSKEFQEIYLFIKANFSSWINSLNTVNVHPDLVLCNNANFLTFNYTEILENQYNISKSNILHIHGSISEDKFVLGHNELLELPFSKEQWANIDPITGEIYESQDLREYHVEQAINNASEKIYNTYFKNSKKLISFYSSWFDKFDNASEIEFRGLSCGEQDEIYIQEIARRISSDCKVLLYGHSEKDIFKMNSIKEKYFSNNYAEVRRW